jgi:hypothetical protein
MLDDHVCERDPAGGLLASWAAPGDLAAPRSDIGVEREAFVPRDRHADAFVADRLTPGNPHPGDDAALRIRASALRDAGVRPGGLL